MHTTTQPAAARRSAAKFLSARVVALRTELSETERSADRPGKATMVKALKADIFTLECRLAEVVS